MSRNESGSISVPWSLNVNDILYVMIGLTLAPLVVKVDPNLNVILTAGLTVFVGCYRSVKPTPPTVSSCCVYSLLHIALFMFQDLSSLNHDSLWLCRRQCRMNMPCVFLLLGVQCYYHFSYSSSFYLRIWWTLFWLATSLCLGLWHCRMFFSLCPINLLFSR